MRVRRRRPARRRAWERPAPGSRLAAPGDLFDEERGDEGGGTQDGADGDTGIVVRDGVADSGLHVVAAILAGAGIVVLAVSVLDRILKTRGSVNQ
ncbi:hypothetical protein ACIHCV_28150 [Streptomyces sp. NPDC051956]|uniref:hypothetical protein n=1 Tax=Streptomyces sp. NPDC051956 TaxID=3365677 RepID=UPI0037D96CDD